VKKLGTGSISLVKYNAAAIVVAGMIIVIENQEYHAVDTTNCTNNVVPIANLQEFIEKLLAEGYEFFHAGVRG
jgi:hypothetical protein